MVKNTQKYSKYSTGEQTKSNKQAKTLIEKFNYSETTPSRLKYLWNYSGIETHIEDLKNLVVYLFCGMFYASGKR